LTRLAKNSTLYFLSAAILLLLIPGSLAAGTLFRPIQNYDSGGEALWVATGDIDGDGKLDLVVANYTGPGSTGSVGVLLGNGDGTFRPPVIYVGVYSPTSVAIADVNGDGVPDLVVTSDCNSNDCNSGLVGVLLGKGDGTFEAVANYGSGGYLPHSATVDDINGDGNEDLIMANACADSNNCADGGSLSVLLGNGDGTFQTAVSYDLGGADYAYADSVVVSDITKNGKLDLMAASGCAGTASCGNGSWVSVLLGNGDGTFGPPVNYISGGRGSYYADSVTVGDVNGDGIPDLLVANDDTTVGILFGNGDGTFQPVVLYESGGRGSFGPALIDVNGDGIPDLLLAAGCENLRKCNANYGGELCVLLGDGGGAFGQAKKYPLGLLSPQSMAIADLNGDGKPDIVVAGLNSSGGGGIGVLLGTARLYTTTVLNSNPNPSTYGQAVTLMATVSSAVPGGATGKVTFENGTKKLGAATLISGMAMLTTMKLPVGTLSLTAIYDGDSNSGKSTSPVLVQVVNPSVHEGEQCENAYHSLCSFSYIRSGILRVRQEAYLRSTEAAE
jgi:hypothetical protein